MTRKQRIAALAVTIAKFHVLEAEVKAKRLEAQEAHRRLLVEESYSLIDEYLLDEMFVDQYPTTDDQWEIDQQKLADLHDPLVYRVEGS
jgi:hypothetical protein